ncbi:MAG: hypothetical protein O3B86_07415 [Planctomycetota bacterium]|nr:hypothetical protein [Planctomycetota bacterium]
MRRRNCSLTENLEPRLVLSPLSFRGSVDPPRSTPPEETPVLVSARDSQGQDLQRPFVLDASDIVVGTEVPVLTPVVPPVTGTTEPGGIPSVDVEDELDDVAATGVRTVLSGDDTIEDDLAGDSLLTDDRTSVLVDSGTNADGTRVEAESDAERRVKVFTVGIDSSSDSSPASSTEAGLNRTVDASKNVRVASGVRDVLDRAEKTMSPAVSYSSPVPVTTAEGGVPSWITSLTDSVTSWLDFEGLQSGMSTSMVDSSVPYVALAGGFSLVAVGRKGLSDAEAFEADDPGAGLWKPDRRSGRPTDRRRFRWFGFATKDRRNRPSEEVSPERPTSKQNLAEPDISEAFAMSLMQSVGEDAFVLSPMPSGDELPDDDSEDSSLSLELVAAGAVTVVGGAYAGRSRGSKRPNHVRPTIDYSGTTLPRS